MERLEDRQLLTVVTLHPSKDNTLVENATGSRSNGAGDIFVGLNNDGNRIRRGLLAFDVAGSIPAGSTINSASLTMWLNRSQVGNRNVELHKVLADWGEAGSSGGGEGGTAQTGDATWLHKFFSNQFWVNPGGDFSPTVSGVKAIGASGAAYTWSSTVQMVADVQNWLNNSTTNFGWLLKGDETQRSSKRFDSGESTTASRQPVLTIDYTAPAVSPNLSISDATLEEGQTGTADLQFTVTLSTASSQAVSVNYATADGTATSGVDYSTAAAALTFAPGETSKTVQVSVIGDKVVELNETLFVNLSGAQNAQLLDAQGQGTITNDDAAHLTINDVAVAEGNAGTTSMTFTVTLDSGVDTPLSVNYSTQNGNATVGDGDYGATTGTLDFAGTLGETKTLSVSINGDTKVELDETLLVDLSNVVASGRNVTLADSQGLGTITNDDSAAVTIDNVTVAEGNSGTTNVVFTVTLHAAVDVPVLVDYVTKDGTATAADGDYVSASGTLVFAGTANESRTITVLAHGDQASELDESFFVDLTNLLADGRSVTLAVSQGQGTLANDDPALLSVALQPMRDNTLIEDPAGALSNGAGDIFVGQNSKGNLIRRGLVAFDVAGSIPAGAIIHSVTLTMYVTQTQVGDIPVSLHSVLANWGEAGSSGAGTGGPAQPGDATWLHTFYDGQTWTNVGGDFRPTSSAIQTIGAQAAFYQWTSTLQLVTDVQGWLDQPGTNFGWLLQADELQTTAKRFASRESAVPTQRPLLTIMYTEPVRPQIVISDAKVVEGNAGTTIVQFDVSMSAPSSNLVTVNFATADGSANSATDYTSTAGTLSFAPQETTKTITIEVHGDEILEVDEQFFVDLTNPIGATVGVGRGIGTILDDESPSGHKRWHNARLPLDVNDDRSIMPFDALLVINRLNAHGAGRELPTLPELPPPYYDVSGDDDCSPFDALLVINYLNHGDGEGEASLRVSALQTTADRVANGQLASREVMNGESGRDEAAEGWGSIASSAGRLKEKATPALARRPASPGNDNPLDVREGRADRSVVRQPRESQFDIDENDHACGDLQDVLDMIAEDVAGTWTHS